MLVTQEHSTDKALMSADCIVRLTMSKSVLWAIAAASLKTLELQIRTLMARKVSVLYADITSVVLSSIVLVHVI